MGRREYPGYPGIDLRHVRSVVGAVNPRDGQLGSLIVLHHDRAGFQAFLDTMAQEVSRADKTIWLVVDNASWHHAKSVNWHHIRPMYLPPCSPDLNLIEHLWQRIKSHYLVGFITSCYEELTDNLEESIRALPKDPKNSRPSAALLPHNGNYFGMSYRIEVKEPDS